MVKTAAELPSLAQDRHVRDAEAAEQLARQEMEQAERELRDLWTHAVGPFDGVERRPPPGHPCWAAAWKRDQAVGAHRSAALELERVRSAARDKLQREVYQRARRLVADVDAALQQVTVVCAEYEALTRHAEQHCGVRIPGLGSVPLYTTNLRAWLEGFLRHSGLPRKV